MNVSGYQQDELNLFREVLNRAVAEAALEVPVELMTRRLFKAAQTGERDPARLLDIVLGRIPLIPPKSPFNIEALASGRDSYAI